MQKPIQMAQNDQVIDFTLSLLLCAKWKVAKRRWREKNRLRNNANESLDGHLTKNGHSKAKIDVKRKQVNALNGNRFYCRLSIVMYHIHFGLQTVALWCTMWMWVTFLHENRSMDSHKQSLNLNYTCNLVKQTSLKTRYLPTRYIYVDTSCE